MSGRSRTERLRPEDRARHRPHSGRPAADPRGRGRGDPGRSGRRRGQHGSASRPAGHPRDRRHRPPRPARARFGPLPQRAGPGPRARGRRPDRRVDPCPHLPVRGARDRRGRLLVHAAQLRRDDPDGHHVSRGPGRLRHGWGRSGPDRLRDARRVRVGRHGRVPEGLRAPRRLPGTQDDRGDAGRERAAGEALAQDRRRPGPRLLRPAPGAEHLRRAVPGGQGLRRPRPDAGPVPLPAARALRGDEGAGRHEHRPVDGGARRPRPELAPGPHGRRLGLRCGHRENARRPGRPRPAGRTRRASCPSCWHAA